MHTISGCLTAVGVATALVLSTGNDAAAQDAKVVCQNTTVQPIVDNVSNYEADCPQNPVPGQPGTDGVCMRSIKDAVGCAEAFYAQAANTNEASWNYTLTVGDRTLPLILI